MNKGPNSNGTAESSLVKLYMELTGASESRARSVFMHICGGNREPTNRARWEPGVLGERVLGGGYVSAGSRRDGQKTYKEFPAAIPAASGA
jgi:hypothetical protein